MRTILLLALLAACPHPAATPDAAPEDCGLHETLWLRGPGGAWAPSTSATAIELVLGFQGFRYVYLRAHLDVAPPGAIATAIVQLDGDAARAQVLGALELAPADGGVDTQRFQVFFNDEPLASLVGHAATFTLRVAAGACGTGDQAHATITYDPGCVEGPDGTEVCVDAGVPDGGP